MESNVRNGSRVNIQIEGFNGPCGFSTFKDAIQAAYQSVTHPTPGTLAYVGDTDTVFRVLSSEYGGRVEGFMVVDLEIV